MHVVQLTRSQSIEGKDFNVGIYTLFHFAGSDALISGIPEFTYVEINPQTPQGTKIYSYNLFLNITVGSPLMELDGNPTISWYLYYGETYHGENSSSYEYWDYIDHYYEPQFGIKVPGMEVSTFVDLTGPIEGLFPVSNPEIEQCSWGNFTFIKVPVDVYLVSPYVYHLGTSFIHSRILAESYSQSTYLYNSLGVETNVGEELMLFQCACKTVLNWSDEIFMISIQTMSQ